MEMHSPSSKPDVQVMAGQDARGRAPGLTSRIGSAIGSLANTFARWRSYQRNLHELHCMDDRTLADLGLTRGGLESAVRYGRASLPPGR